ncbi:MAG: SagB/ThcOx family dehydrogenase [Candidatus Tectomicrobia bacterium]|nr:SagB/ThcOx family dehydrogenase [Candidatus Tectomicrobia bacterium]
MSQQLTTKPFEPAAERPDVKAAWDYHDSTKHSYWSVRSNPHSLDFSNKPLPFKIYRDLPSLALPEAVESSTVPALRAIAAGDPFEGRAGRMDAIPDLALLARLLRFAAGITKRRTYGEKLEIFFRAAACTGALYHIDLYAVCGDLPDLAAGVYHYGPHDNTLRLLRRGDCRPQLVEATAGEDYASQAPVILIAASTFWRNSWKYQARAWRHCFWDSGTILANLLAIAAAEDFPARLLVGFQDDLVNHLVGLDEQREAALALIPLGFSQAVTPKARHRLEPLELQTEPLSQHEVDYPDLRAVHAATSFRGVGEVEAWRAARGTPSAEPEPDGMLYHLRPLHAATLSQAPIEEVIVRRGSSRRFRPDSLTFGQLSTVLQLATQGIAADFLHPFGATLSSIYLIVHAIEGVRPGSYSYHRGQQSLELLKQGTFRAEAGRLGLEQALAADASVNIYFLADLKEVLAHWGGRGYRAAQLEAAVMAGKMYVAAYAQGFGATGLTFYDDEVTAFFSPHASGKSVMFLLALGVPDRLIRTLRR